MNGLFITGCGTDIGKTVVTAAFLLCAKSLGINATVFKPVQTGCSATMDTDGSSGLELPDLDFISDICCATAAEAKLLKSHYTYAFLPACSPHLAAKLSGKGEISLDRIYTEIKAAEKNYDLIIVEGAGGILVPLNEDDTFRSLAQLLNYETIIVADNRLGCINEALLTVEALNSKELSPLGIIMNNTSKQDSQGDYIRKDNTGIIERCTGVPVITEIPYSTDLSRSNKDFWKTVAGRLQTILRHVTAIERV